MSPTGSKGGFIEPLHAFRGVAIVNIVAVHAGSLAIYDFGGGTQDRGGLRLLAALNEVLFHSATLYFAFISGLLFSAVLSARGWPRFFANKLKYVLLPYVVMSTLFTALHWHWSQHFDVFSGSPLAFVQTAGQHILAGTAMDPFWYIPVLACLFALTPAVHALLERKSLRWMVWLLVLAPLLVSRTGADVSVANVVYFLGAYACGMALGRDYAAASLWIEGHARWLALAAILLGLALLALIWTGYDRVGPVSVRETLFYLQKGALAGVFLTILSRWQTIPPLLARLADHAFAIYFLHLFALYTLAAGLRGLVGTPVPLYGVALVFGGLLAASLGVCLAVSAGFRAALGKRARLLIGS
ncbi:acyltransferase family protein [Marinicauda pacifica]|jgi:peptidoglycan/LPS O-acetylase OafA/YrhL|uniref:acyltransferase family protein n=1 Tax=Marinicauda pacifica TaxID=1133559 RepID=UPI0035C862AE